MHKVLISIPDNLAFRLKAAIPSRQRSKVITTLITKEVELRENELYNCALEVEADKALNDDMHAWDISLNDGFEVLDNGTR